MRPTVWGAVPRIWEKMKAALEAQGVTDPAALPEEHRAAIREKLGLDQCAWLVVGAAPTPVEVLEYFAALGLPICELWGMSETSSLRHDQPARTRIKIGTCGPPIEGRRAEARRRRRAAGARATIVMKGYRNDPEKTAEAIDDDGWLHTGDVAEIDDDGYVKIVDRKKELIINAAGKNMSPANIESRLKTCHPLIGQAVAIGDRRPYNVALIVLDPDACAAFAKEHGIDDGSPAALARDERVRAAIAAAIEEANTHLSRVEQIKKFGCLLETEWQPGGDELTPTMKLKRRPIAAEVRRGDRSALRVAATSCTRRTARGRGLRLRSPCRAARAAARSRSGSRSSSHEGPLLDLQAVAAVLGDREGQREVVARHGRALDRHPVLHDLQLDGAVRRVGFHRSPRATKSAEAPRSVSPKMAGARRFLAALAVRRTSGPALPVSFTYVWPAIRALDALLREPVRVHDRRRRADRRLRAQPARCARPGASR